MIKQLLILLFFFLINYQALSIENKILIKINNEIITTLDIYSEINNLKFFNKNLNDINNEEIYQIAIQSITRKKIKELELKENYRNINFSGQEYLNLLIKETYENLGFKNLKQFKEELIRQNLSFLDFEKKLKNDIIWNELIYKMYSKRVVLDENKIKSQIKQNNKVFNKSFYLKEIIYQIKDLNDKGKIYQLIKEDIEKLGFENAALKHSLSDTAQIGGNLGWVEEKLISKEILAQLNSIPNQYITKPIKIASGFMILKKVDEKEEEKNLDFDKELEKLMNYETNQQLKNYSYLHLNKIKKNYKINAP
jgi:peptidyl-prolyl cis-trans isomerase SurA